MVKCCCCFYCERYNIFCRYKYRNTFNCGLFTHLKFLNEIFECFCKENKNGNNNCSDDPCVCCECLCCTLILVPISFVLDIIVYPFRYYFSFYKYCECKKINLVDIHVNSNVIIEIPPSYNEHYRHTRIIQEITNPPSYQV